MEAARFGRASCGDLEIASRREWLLTNGRGGYAMGTLAGMPARAYHGLLIAALAPPVERRMILTGCELDVTYDGVSYALATNVWTSGAIAPEGYRFLESFVLRDGLPTWTYACGDALVELTLAMPDGADAIAFALRAVRARVPLAVRARLLFSDRDHHGGALPDPATFAVMIDADRAEIVLPQSRRTVYVRAPGATLTAAAETYAGFFLAREAERGLPATTDAAHLLTLEVTLAPQAAGGFVVTLDPAVDADANAIVAARRARDRKREPLALAADAFLVSRGDGGRTVIAGYPWFGDWGRDTMIALPGLTLLTGRASVAAEILRTFAATVDGGMLPNRFPDDGSPAEYNTVDAALWYIEAVRAYVTATSDEKLLRDIFPALDAIVTGYRDGTRYGIGTDSDGLVHAGVPGVQLTWMDAKVGDWVVTPRIGKPIEIAALWYNALRHLAILAPRAGIDGTKYAAYAEATAKGIERFWNDERGYCYDVLDGPSGNDPSLRPNQLFALSLPHSPLAPERGRAIVRVCAEQLFASTGLRSLGPHEAAYTGFYGGSPYARDGAYHQGTSWLWLLPVFATAYARAFNDEKGARRYLDAYADALQRQAVGTLGEIADGDAPFAPRGAFAQAWSVAEAIRGWHDVARMPSAYKSYS
jgi:predicted glycogen debranching enzyme